MLATDRGGFVRLLTILLLCCALIVCACASANEQPAPQPTQIPVATDLAAAAETARRFLNAWQVGDLDAMHRLLTFRNRELTPLGEFRALYEQAHAAMSFVGLDYKLQTLTGEGRFLTLQYEVTFHTRILGAFSDSQRMLHLVVDSQVGEWRIAWSRADIFREMGEGARLVFEAQLPGRANIYDRYGTALADQNGRVVRIQVDNRRIPDREACFQALAEATGETPADMDELFNRRSKPDWVVDAGVIERDAFIRLHDRIEAACAADFVQQPTRRYLDGALMPHIIGHVGYADAEKLPSLLEAGLHAETIIGKAGIEASMNSTLAGAPGGKLSLVAADGRRLRVLSEARSQVPKSLWLTVDADLQRAISGILRDAFANGPFADDSNGAAVIIMDVNNGDILALVSYPAYDSNILNPFPTMGREAAHTALEELIADERNPLLNRGAQGTYVTGSVMKVMSSVAALESGVYTQDTRYTCIGSWSYGADLRYDWLRAGHGVMSVQTGIANSCNPFFYEVGFRLNAQDPQLLPGYAQMLGLGQPTGADAIAEAAGYIPAPDTIQRLTGVPWSYAHAVNLSIGQGEVQVTPLQMLRMYAAVANGGYLLRPQLVREQGILDEREPVARRDVMRDLALDADNLAIIQRGMCDVTSAYSGTASAQFVYSPLLDVGVCGKTGTAQVPGERKLPHSWFIAYAPAQEPQIAIVTLVENGGEGSSVAAPLTREILEYYYFSGL